MDLSVTCPSLLHPNQPELQPVSHWHHKEYHRASKRHETKKTLKKILFEW